MQNKTAPPDAKRSTEPGPSAVDAPAATATLERPHYQHADSNPRGRRLAVLTLTALGVVYGDIGTSPLYTLKECFSAEHGLTPNALNVYGILSLIFWSLMLVVVFKYLVFILRADNRGEGGVLALLALVLQRSHGADDQRRRWLLIVIGVFGTALLYGDGVITPAISVLGAVEGLEVLTPALQPYVVGITATILLALFLVQHLGTAMIGRAFGPITLLWFLAIGAMGFPEIARNPRILLAINPVHAVRFFTENGFVGFAVLGAVFLAVTGAEALYADIGHFGKRPIRLAFFTFALPALLLNYFGQGALVLRNPAAIANPFYLLAPRALLYPVLVIATLAAIVASQALISGAYSLAQQSIQLGYSPRLTIIHTSKKEYGQIYVPEVNKMLMVGTLLIVFGFKSTSALGAAYGIAVTGTMGITTILFSVVAYRHWNWSLGRVAWLTAIFLSFDLAFLSANALKIERGGWVPLAIAAAVFSLMTTWKKGRDLLRGITQRASLPLDLLLTDIERKSPTRVSGTAVFLTSDQTGAPVVLMHHLKHNKSLHERVILLSIFAAETPDVDEANRVTVAELGQGFFRVTAMYGFMEQPSVPDVLRLCREHGLHTRSGDTSFYMGRERLLPTGPAKLAKWRKQLFVVMSRNAQSATEYFQIPPNRAVELGAQIEF